MKKKIIIQAYNIHQGGGRSQLIALLDALRNFPSVKVFVDQRLDFKEEKYKNIEFVFVKPKILERFKVEVLLYLNTNINNITLCFGNLPPLFRLKSYVIVFVQNKYLITKTSLRNFSWKTKLRIAIERFWFSCLHSHANDFIVQTPSMKKILSSKIKNNVSMIPYLNNTNYYNRSVKPKKKSKKILDYDFIYVASGEPHKNHKRLVDAWILLSNENIYPSLCITIDESYFKELYYWIEKKKKTYSLNINNIGVVKHDRIKSLFYNVGALIYPSIIESFGLPLIEARQANLEILAPELNYVRDIVDPEQSFDPYSSTSIARAVKRHLNINELKLPLHSAAEFAQYINKK